MKLRLGMAAALLAASVTACAPTTQRPGVDSAAVKAEELEQLKLALRQDLDDARRVYRVSNRIGTAAYDFCDRKGWRMGFLAYSLVDFPEAQKPAAQAVIPGLNNTPMVTFVSPDSAAEKAGLKPGDQILKVAGKETPAGSGAVKALAELLAGVKASDSVMMSVRRGDATMDIPMVAAPACDYRWAIEKKPEINAFADGERVVFTTGMLRFAQSDEELALVMGHEYAHNFRGHIAAKRGNAVAGQVVGTILDILAAAGGVNTGGAMGNTLGQVGGGAFSQDFESEADYAGLYVMARAGYSIDDAPNFWRRMAVANPNGITHATSHPATPDRFIALSAAIREIKDKQASGAPLQPNEKPKEVLSDSAADGSLLNLPH